MTTNNLCDEGTAVSGKILQGQGITVASNYSVATYPSTATGTGKILRADGTNWVPSTATFPDTAGTSGNVLTSDGTNWSSQPPPGASSVLLIVTGILTNAQIKSLHASPVTIVAAPGAGKILVPYSASMTMNFGSSNFVASAGQTINLYYSTSLNIKQILNNSIVTGGNQYRFQQMLDNTTRTLSSFLNLELTLYNPVATEISGNAANDNTMSYEFVYCIMTP